MEGLTYFLITRKLFDSPIWRDNPHNLKLFLYLVGMARHDKKSKRFNGFEVKRGELVTSLSSIVEDNEYMDGRWVKKWSRQKVSRMLKKLTDDGYISLLSDTYGTHIKVINYDTYQDPKTYKRTRVEHGCDMGGTSPSIYNKDNNVNNEKKKDIVEYPDWLDLKIWKEFKSHKIALKNKMTPQAEKLNITKLKNVISAGYTQKEVIDHVIEKGWKGIYPPDYPPSQPEAKQESIEDVLS